MTYEALALQKTPIVTFGYIIQIAFSFAIVLALIYFSAKYVFPRLSTSSKGNNLKIIDRMGLEPQVTIYQVEIKNKEYIIGVSNKNITLIDKPGEK
ncbi:MAG: hypothetical protein FD145_1345 [Candidatus Saganbacteria bacterium]|uniref:Flagellar protein n=1 Tax=Candidatus Saganbacteria bacterium TaxID=2575572 RepID=A0A833NWK0_UNCSA|nr:MAG: hypothetical protein FD145_1345 [Candidatus Saganbacteria bacterium]